MANYANFSYLPNNVMKISWAAPNFPTHVFGHRGSQVAAPVNKVIFNSPKN